ncbi:hypothetical protein EIN_253510 [Entamoeba invadens IP1]|uniref:Uncharacterized protein n=1 Tax=Entamoeba invadens IP1 TaxID=370355 RepID=A0A0A1UHC4_ENTIV|nr:hypothetical protein EIN_253510 [Entamoeba invadens IP1]ELP95077.1 hypothetical protein EIN_253510 [Entamoeba invadens IP1]|eukprot:XP_004261848.1 hypothetical protein EIN_253510 [Entamoeba invadens IP1]
MGDLIGSALFAGLSFGLFKVACDTLDTFLREKIPEVCDDESKKLETTKNTDFTIENEDVENTTKETHDHKDDVTEIPLEEVKTYVETHYEGYKSAINRNEVDVAESELLKVIDLLKNVGQLKGIEGCSLLKEESSLRFMHSDYEASIDFLVMSLELLKDVSSTTEQEQTDVTLLEIESLNQLVQAKTLLTKYTNCNNPEKIISEAEMSANEALDKLRKLPGDYEDLSFEISLSLIQVKVFQKDWISAEKIGSALLQNHSKIPETDPKKVALRTWLSSIYVALNDKDRLEKVLEYSREHSEGVEKIEAYQTSSELLLDCSDNESAIKYGLQTLSFINESQVELTEDLETLMVQTFYTLLDAFENTKNATHYNKYFEMLLQNLPKNKTILVHSHILRTVEIQQIPSAENNIFNIVTKFLVRSVGASALPKTYKANISYYDTDNTCLCSTIDFTLNQPQTTFTLTSPPLTLTKNKNYYFIVSLKDNETTFSKHRQFFMIV